MKFNVLKSFGLHLQLKHATKFFGVLITAVFKSFDDKKDQDGCYKGTMHTRLIKNLSVLRYVQPNFHAFYKCALLFFLEYKEQKQL